MVQTVAPAETGGRIVCVGGSCPVGIPGPTMTPMSAARKNGYIEAHRRCFGSGGAAAMALRAACSGIANTKSHTIQHLNELHRSVRRCGFVSG